MLFLAPQGLGAGVFDAKEQKHYAYYQWVCFILFFQAILCYVPRWLWGAWEGNSIWRSKSKKL